MAAPVSGSTRTAMYAEIDDTILRYELKRRRGRADRQARAIVTRHADHRRSSDASLRHRRERQPIRVHGSATMPARWRTACRTRPATILARSSRPAPVSGATTPTRRVRSSRPGVSPPASATAKGFDFDATGRLFVTQHGRDQLYENWPNLYTPEQGADLPAEELVELERGRRLRMAELLLTTEHRRSLCWRRSMAATAARRSAIARQASRRSRPFRPTGRPTLSVYFGTNFPAGYRGGAFIAFHGSWNRAPCRRAGTMSSSSRSPTARRPATTSSSPTASPAVQGPGPRRHRPSGLAVGPDGALYISDDGTAASGASPTTATAPTRSLRLRRRRLPPRQLPHRTPFRRKGVHPDAGRQTLPTLPGATPEQWRSAAASSTARPPTAPAREGGGESSGRAWPSRSATRVSCRRWAEAPHEEQLAAVSADAWGWVM